MYLCVYIYMCIGINIYMYIYTYTYIYIHTCTLYIYTHTHVYTVHTHPHPNRHTDTHVCTYLLDTFGRRGGGIHHGVNKRSRLVRERAHRFRAALPKEMFTFEKRPTKETHKRDQKKKPTKETYQKIRATRSRAIRTAIGPVISKEPLVF